MASAAVLMAMPLIVLAVFVRLLFKPAPPSDVIRAKPLPSTKRVLTTFFVGFAVAFVAGLVLFYPTYRKDVGIQQHGLRAEAEVVKAYRGCTRGGCDLAVAYRYALPNSAGRLTYMTGERWLPDPQRDDFSASILARRIDRVRIVYDSTDPGVSTIDYPIDGARDRPTGDLWFMFSMCLAFAPFAGLLALALCGLIVPSTKPTPGMA